MIENQRTALLVQPSLACLCLTHSEMSSLVCNCRSTTGTHACAVAGCEAAAVSIKGVMKSSCLQEQVLNKAPHVCSNIHRAHGSLCAPAHVLLQGLPRVDDAGTVGNLTAEPLVQALARETDAAEKKELARLGKEIDAHQRQLKSLDVNAHTLDQRHQDKQRSLLARTGKAVESVTVAADQTSVKYKQVRFLFLVFIWICRVLGS